MLISITLIISSFLTAEADIYERPNKHVIISFDTAIPDFATELRNRSLMENSLQSVLNKIELTEDDYISLVNFGISQKSKNLRELSRSIKDKNGKPMTWLPYTTLSSILSMGKSWQNMIDEQGISYTARDQSAFSILTGSKAYTLLSQRNKAKDDKIAGETYLIMVTDDNYNGCDDINKEFSLMYAPYLSQNEFLEQCREVAKYYNFYYEKALSNEKISVKGNKTYKAMVYKVLPSSNMALSSVVDYPANLGLKRVKGGYKLDFDFQCADGDYLIRKFEVSYKGKKGDKYADCYTYDSKADKYEDNAQHISLLIPHSHIQGNKLDVDMKVWLQQTDNIYGSAMLNPNSEDFSRLNVSTSLNIKNEAKALGYIPIPDIFWIGNNVTTQVQIWNLIWVFVIIILLYLLYRHLVKKFSRYVPDNSEITMYMREAPKQSAEASSSQNNSRRKNKKKKKNKT